MTASANDCRLIEDEWCKAQQLGDTYGLSVVWNPLNGPDPVPLMVKIRRGISTTPRRRLWLRATTTCRRKRLTGRSTAARRAVRGISNLFWGNRTEDKQMFSPKSIKPSVHKLAVVELGVTMVFPD